MAEESYYSGLMDDVLPALGSISMRRLLVAWGILYALAKAQMDRFPNMSCISKIKSLLQYAPSIKRSDLMEIFKQSNCFKIEEINKIIDFFTFEPSPHNEIWDAPLIRLEKGKYAVAIGPLLHGNLLRTMEHFMVRGKLDIAKKGPAFEEDCRRRINKAITKNPLFSSCGVFSKSYSLRTPANDEEEIDIILWIGNELFLGEAKCILFPADRMDFFNYYDTIEGAISQAERKANFANIHIKQVVQELNLSLDCDSVNIKPFVIVNSAFGAGFTCRNIPITDPLIMTLFLRQNKINHFVTLPEKSESDPAGSVTTLYTTEAEASRNFYEYLSRPPQVEMYKNFLNRKLYPMPQLSDQGKPFLVSSYEVIMPFPDFSTD